MRRSIIIAVLLAGVTSSFEAAAASTCEFLVEESKDRSKTVTERSRSASEAVSCVRRQRAAALEDRTERTGRASSTLESLAIDQKEAEAAEQTAKSEESFLGLTWGLGFGYSFSSDKAINDAEIVNGIVRAKSDLQQQPRALFEFHRYFWCNNGGKDGTQGCGPFVAVAASPEKVLSGVGMGFMYGRKTSATASDGFSIGVGAILDAKVKDLADGFEENKPPPPGETTVRFKEKARWSAILFVTRTF